MRIQERLYLTEDESEVVNEHDRRGRHLFAKRGDEIPDELAMKYGLMPAPAAKSVIAQPEVKRAKKVEKTE